MNNKKFMVMKNISLEYYVLTTESSFFKKLTLCLDDNRARLVSRDPGNDSRRDTPPNQTSKRTAGNTAHAHCFQSLGNHDGSWLAHFIIIRQSEPSWKTGPTRPIHETLKCRVQFVSDTFAFVFDCQCVLLPRSPGMCLWTWAMRNLKRLESTRLVTDTKSSRQLKKNSLAYQNWVSELIL